MIHIQTIFFRAKFQLKIKRCFHKKLEMTNRNARMQRLQIKKNSANKTNFNDILTTLDWKSPKYQRGYWPVTNVLRNTYGMVMFGIGEAQQSNRS